MIILRGILFTECAFTSEDECTGCPKFDRHNTNNSRTGRYINEEGLCMGKSSLRSLIKEYRMMSSGNDASEL